MASNSTHKGSPRRANFPAQLQQLGQLFQARRLPQARDLGRRLLADHPKQPQLLALLGAIHGQLGEFADAQTCYQTLVKLAPQTPEYHYYLGMSQVMQGRLQAAIEPFETMLRLAPEFAEGHMQMGCLRRDLGQPDLAVRHLERALSLRPGLTEAAVYLGNLQVFLGHLETALTCYQQALAQRPGQPDALAGKALVLERQGQRRAAWQALQPIIGSGRETANAAIIYALLAPDFQATAQAQALLQGLLARGGWAPSQQQELHFALAKLSDKAAQYDLAFMHYRAANDLAAVGFDRVAAQDKARRIRQYFRRGVPPSLPLPGSSEPIPLFIVGMPRSGTSLVEQMLASHSQVAAGGELELLAQLEARLPAQLGSQLSYPECLQAAQADSLAALAQDYLAAIQPIAQGCRYVTDKLPGNYQRLGLIQCLFPHARIIHTVRDARDTCLSCYFQNFGHTQRYASNLRDLASVYNAYRALMRHWHATLQLPLFDVHYEALVSEPEATLRQLLAFCDLPWQDACLQFHRNPRQVRTASYNQVRQPLYRSAVGRWQHYQAHLGELLEALELPPSETMHA